jgi:hypothetical protein
LWGWIDRPLIPVDVGAEPDPMVDGELMRYVPQNV